MRVTIRQTRLLLWTFSALLIVASVALWYAGLALPPEVGIEKVQDAQREGDRVIADDRMEPLKAPNLAEFEPVFTLNLRRPLYDPPPPKPPPKPPPPPLKIRLTGTVIEEADAMAMIADGKGDTIFARVGDTIEEATITKITKDTVEVQYYKETRILKSGDGSR